MPKYFHFFYSVFFLCLLIFNSCVTGVEDSPMPGIVRINLQSEPSDTILVEKSDTFAISQKYPATFEIKTFQGRIYKDSNFAVLYKTIFSYRQEDTIFNILKLDTLGKYQKYSIFESKVPPGSYNKLEFGLNSTDKKLKIIALNGKTFENPIELPNGAKLLIAFDVNFNISSEKVTQIDVQLSPFKSIKRYQDSYQFFRQMKVVGVTNN